jgi:hypothetical protein
LERDCPENTIFFLTNLRTSFDSFLEYGSAYSLLSLKGAKEADL